MATETHVAKKAHVTLSVGDETRHVEVAAGPTVVLELKREFLLPETDVLYLVHGHERRPLSDQETIDVKSGLHFEAIPAGGVS